MNIELTSITRSFGGNKAVDGVSLQAGPGVLGLLGPNGAGKTSLLRMLATVLPPSSGGIRLLDRDPTNAAQRRDIRRGLGYLPQNLGCYPAFTVTEFGEYFALLKDVPPGRVNKAVAAAVERVDLGAKAKSRLRTLSGGMLRRVGIAQAIVNDPDLLLLDEPTAGLDPEQRVVFRAMLRDLGQDATVVVSTHLVEDVGAACSQVALMDAGHIVFRGAPAELAGRGAGHDVGDSPLERGYSAVLETAVSLTAVCAFAFALGALFPGRFTAPIVAVGISMLTLAVFSRTVSEGGTSVFALLPDGIVPGNDAGVFYPVAPDVSIVQVMFFAGCTLGAVGLLGLSPRTGVAGWRGALDVASGGGARLRAVAAGVFAAGIALAVIGFGLAATARVSSVTGEVVVPALDGASGKPIPYTPVCSDASGGFRVCLHPAYKSYLDQTVSSFGPVIAELSGLPGVPVRAVEVFGQSLPQVVLQANTDGVVTGNPPVYEFSMDDALPQVADPARLRDGLRQDIVHAVIVGPAGHLTADGGFQQDVGTPAQQAVADGLLKAIGSQPYPVYGTDGNPVTPPEPVTAAAARFAALPAATRHGWLAANLAALKAGHITLAQIP